MPNLTRRGNAAGARPTCACANTRGATWCCKKAAVGDSLLFLLSGQLQVIDITEDGRAIGLRMLAPGDFFGEIAVINGSIRSASVVALTPVLVALLPRHTALHLFSHSPSVANHMLRFLAEKMQRDSQFRALLSIHNTAKRIYSYIDLLKEKAAGDVHVVENLPTHQDIANMINTSRETVTRTLLLLAQQGIIQKGAHRLIIVDPEALKKLAQGLTLPNPPCGTCYNLAPIFRAAAPTILMTKTVRQDRT